MRPACFEKLSSTILHCAKSCYAFLPRSISNDMYSCRGKHNVTVDVSVTGAMNARERIICKVGDPMTRSLAGDDGCCWQYYTERFKLRVRIIGSFAVNVISFLPINHLEG